MSEKPVRRRATQEILDAVESQEERMELDITGPVDHSMLIPTGSTLLNLALSDDPYGGFVLGTINNIIGDSQAGKTFLLWSVFAEMTYDERFDEHELIYDEPEAAFAFNTDKLFGGAVGERVDRETVSETVEQFHDNIIAKLKEQVPFIWGLDSLDAIAPEDEIDNDIRKGSFGASKPKLVSQILRKIATKTKNTNSAVFIISQTRDNIGVMFGDKKTRSGGKALKFFSTHEMWLAVIEHIKKKEINAGVYVRVKISKNKITGKERIVEFPIYYDYGIDDITSCIDFLMKQGRWGAPKKDETKKKMPAVRKAIAKKEKPEKKKNDRGTIDTHKEITSQPMDFEDLRLLIAQDPALKEKLVLAVTEEWRKREASIATNLPPKYAR